MKTAPENLCQCDNCSFDRLIAKSKNMNENNLAYYEGLYNQCTNEFKQFCKEHFFLCSEACLKINLSVSRKEMVKEQ
jgi:deoxyadenosine/deoxycytidine kinase